MKKKYCIKNWSEYNKSLIQRGSITIWFSEEAVNQWYNKEHTGKKGCPKVYSDDAILCALMVRSMFHLPLRATQGFLKSLVTLLQLTLAIPCYSQICRRAKELGKKLKQRIGKKKVTDVVFDSTGMKVYGEGEWKVKKHGKGKRRVWKKVHIALDPNTQEILLTEVTNSETSDGEVAKKMLKQLPEELDTVLGDGAYDGFAVREKIAQKGAKAIIPPPKNAIVHNAKEGFLQERDNAVLEILGLKKLMKDEEQARKIWKKLKGYYKRSLVETAMYRLKKLLGDQLVSREEGRQQTEVFVKCLILNKLTRLGMPKGEWIKIN